MSYSERPKIITIFNNAIIRLLIETLSFMVFVLATITKTNLSLSFNIKTEGLWGFLK